MYKVSGYYIDNFVIVETEEEAEATINQWIEEDKKEFPGEDTSNDYYYKKIES